MKIIYSSLFVLITLCIFLISCNDDQVTLEEKDFGSEIERRRDLTFTFSEPVVPDSLVSKSSEVPYITFNPPMDGRFTWVSRDRLVFSPFLSWSPSTEYTATLNDIITKDDKKKRRLEGEKVIRFHTPLLQLGKPYVFWTRNSSQNSLPEVRVNIPLSEKVNSEEIAKKIMVELADKKVKTIVNQQGEVNELSLTIVDPGIENEGKKIEIRALPGINVIGGNLGTSKEMIIQSEVPEVQAIKISEVTPENDGVGTFIKVRTTQTPTTQDLQSLISLTPNVKFDVELTDEGFLLRGDFFTGENYKLFISGALRGVMGGDMGDNVEMNIVFGEMEERIAFTSSKGMYLTSKGEKKIGVTISGITEVVYTISKVFDNNIMHFVREGRGWRDYETGEEWNNYGALDIDNYGEVIVERKIKTASLPKKGNVKILDLNFDDRTLTKGVYIVSVKSAEDRWTGASKIIAISDVGLIAKSSKSEVVVFANSIYTTDPLAGVGITLISKNNQIISKGKTDEKGVCIFSNLDAKFQGQQVAMITSQYGEDFSILHFSQTKTETSRFEVGGIYENKTGYQAFLYGDRNIYRPGETIYFSGIVREKYWQPAKSVPVKLKFLLPNGSDYKTMQFVTDDQGAFETSLTLPNGIITGTFSAELYSGNDVLLTSNYVSVEEFMPDRISVSLRSEKEQAKPGEEVNVHVKAMNLFGPPAVNRTVQTEFSIIPVSFSSKQFPYYTFDMQNDEKKEFPKQRVEDKTSNEGIVNNKFSIPEEYKDYGLLRGKFYTTVFDETGRPVNRMLAIDIWTQPVFFGIRSFDYYVSTNSRLMFNFIALNKDKQITSSEAEVKIVKFNWHNVIEKEGSSYRVVSRKEEIVVKESIILIGNQTEFAFTPSLSGEYEVRIYRKGSERYVARKFHAYGWGNTQATSFEVNKEGTIEIELDKESYVSGESAKVLCKTPFAGKLLVCVERDKVYDYFTVQTDRKSASLTIPIKSEYLPNVYISATVIKPVDDGAIPLTVAHGYKPLIVTKKQNEIPIKIESEENSRSNRKQTITVKTGLANSRVTIAVVDEGILQLKNFKTPDPFNFFYSQRALQVENYNIYPLLFPEFSRLYSSIGGDGYDINKRVNPFTTKRTNLVAIWSGILKADGNGNAKTTIDIPQFSGSLRVMAVAYKDASFGSSEKNIRVADPIVVSSGLPRFVSPGDKITSPVIVTNTTNKNLQINVRCQVSNQLSIKSENQKSISVPPNSEQSVEFTLIAGDEPGICEVQYSASSGNETFTEKTSLSVRPSGGFQKKSGDGIVKAGESTTLNVTNEFLKGSASSKLIVSRSPVVQFADRLKELIEYPHGCAEQIISKAFPQIYFTDLARTLNSSLSSTSDPMNNVQQAISKIEALQIYNGGILYWNHMEVENEWVSVFAAHFFKEAQKAGFNVNEEVTRNLVKYIQYMVQERKTKKYGFYNKEGKRIVYDLIPRNIPYALYVLSLYGKQDLTALNYLKSNTQLLTIDGRYLLAATCKQLGDNASFRLYLPNGFDNGMKSESEFGGTFGSYLRDYGIVLNSLVDTDPTNQQIPSLSRQLSIEIKNRRYLSTQESVFALLAFGKISRSVNSSAEGTIIINDQVIGKANEKDYVNGEVVDKKVLIKASGGTMYYFWQTEGISKSNTVVETDKYVKVRKTFLDRDGNPMNANTFKQNDLIVVKLSLQCLNGQSIENIVLSDLLPAGFEIENPRIGAVPELSWIKDNSNSQHIDLRDDRIHFFTDAIDSPKFYYYLVRAVTKGTYAMGAASADAMYNGDVYSYNGARQVTVN